MAVNVIGNIKAFEVLFGGSNPSPSVKGENMIISASTLNLELEYKKEYFGNWGNYIPEPRKCRGCSIPLEEFREAYTQNGIKYPSGYYTIKSLISPDYNRCPNCYRIEIL